MSFLIKRYSQLLDHINLQENIHSIESIRHYFEAIVPAIWRRQNYIRILLKDLLDNAPPLLSHIQKNTLHVIVEIISSEELKIDHQNEKKTKLELTLEFMDLIGCDLGNIFSLLDINNLEEINFSHHMNQTDLSYSYLKDTSFNIPVHFKLVSLLYDRIPYIPKSVFLKIVNFLNRKETFFFTQYFSFLEIEQSPKISEPLHEILEEICRFSKVMDTAIQNKIEEELVSNIQFFNRLNNHLGTNTLKLATNKTSRSPSKVYYLNSALQT